MAYQFHISITNTEPIVWRRIFVSSDCTLQDFHLAIQGAFGWENYHMFQFCEQDLLDKKVYGIPDQMDETPVIDARRTKLNSIFKKIDDRYSYIYDFGDYWQHEIKLEGISTDEISGPYCVAGESNCPPEDSGGTSGYAHLLEVFRTPRHPEKGSFREWLGLRKTQDWDADYCNLKEINKRLALLAYN